jgi:hypothetical protein
VSDPVIPPDEEQYWRYNPKFLNKYVENKGNVDLAELATPRPQENAPAWVQVVDAIAGTEPTIQRKWEEFRPFILNPGDSTRLRAAADAWCADGESDGSDALASLVGEWKAELHDVMDRLAGDWQDSAARALDSYLNNKVDIACFDALEKKCAAISQALRAMADARDAFAKSIDDAIENTGVAAVAGAVLGGAGVAITAYATGGVGTGFGVSLAVAVATPIVASFVSMVYSCWGIYKDFVTACQASLDKLGVDVGELGEENGRWPRPWDG